MAAEEIPQGSVIVTPTQIYEEMRATRDEVKHLAAIVDPALAEIRGDVAENKSDIQAVKAEVRSEAKTAKTATDAVKADVNRVENRLWFFSGAAAALGTIGGIVAKALLGGG